MNYQELPTRSDKLSQSVIKGLERRGPEHCAFFDSCCLDVPENLKEVELILKTLVMKKIKDGVDVFILTNPDWFQLLAGQVLISMREYYNIPVSYTHLCEDALLRACELVELLGAGEVVDGMIDCFPVEKPPVRLKLEHDWINRFLDIDLSAEKMAEIL